MVSVQSLKIILLSILLLFTFVFSMIPIGLIKLVVKQTNDTQKRLLKNTISFLSCYAAGVFLATCLLDLFPQVRDKLGQAFDMEEIWTSYPVAEFILVLGLFIMLIIEQFVLTIKEKHSGRDQNDSYAPLLQDDSSDNEGPSSPHKPSSQLSAGYRSCDTSDNHQDGGNFNIQGPSTDLENVNYEDNIDQIPDISLPSLDPVREIENESEYHDPSSHSLIRSVMLLLALSLHSIFEGLAIGLQPTFSDVMQIFAPVALHKSILAFSLGLNLAQSKMSLCSIIKSNSIFAITSPLGIGLGIAIVDLSPDTFVANLVNGILQGLACGTFFYVIFFEILPHEFMSNNCEPNRLLKTTFLILGYATISVILLFNQDGIRPVCESGSKPAP